MSKKGNNPELRWQGYDRSGNKYRARISLPIRPGEERAQRPALGAFDTEEEAASAYNEALLILGRQPVNRGLGDVDFDSSPPMYLGLPDGNMGHRRPSLIRADTMMKLRACEGLKQQQVRTSDPGHNLQPLAQHSMPPMATCWGLGRTSVAVLNEVPYIVVPLGPSGLPMGPSQSSVPQHADTLPADPAYPTIHPLQSIPRTVTTMPAGSAQAPRWGDNDLQQPPQHAFSLPTGAAALPPFAPPHLFPNHLHQNHQQDSHLMAPPATNGTATNGTNGHHQHHLPMEGSLEFNSLLLAAVLENTRGGSSMSLSLDLDEQLLHQEPAGPAGPAVPADAAAHVRPSSPILNIAPGSTQLPSTYPELASRGFDPLQQQLHGFLQAPAAGPAAGPAAAAGPLESPYANPPSWAVDDLADAAAAGPAAGTKKKRNLKEFSSPFLASGRPSGTPAASGPASGSQEARQQPDQLPAGSPNTSPSRAQAGPPPSSSSLGDIQGARRLLRLASSRSGRNRMVLVDPDAGLMDLDIFDLSGNPIEVESLGSAGAMSLSMEDPFRPSSHSLGQLAPVYEGFPPPSELLAPSHLLDQALASGPVPAAAAPAAAAPEPAEQQLLETFQSLDLKAGAEQGGGAPGEGMEHASSLQGALDAFASGPVGYDFNSLQAPSFDLSSLLRQETRRAYNRSLSKSMAFGEDMQQQQDVHAAAAAGGSPEAARQAVLSPGAQQRKRELEHHAMVDEGMQEDGLDFMTDMDRAAMAVGGVLEADMLTLEQRSMRSPSPTQIMHPHTQAFALLPMHLVQGDGVGSPEELLAGMTYKMQHADGLPEGVVVVHGRQKRQKFGHRCASVKWVSEEHARQEQQASEAEASEGQ